MRWFADRSLERMRSLLMAIRSRDFSMRFPVEGLRGKERELAEEMNGVVADFIMNCCIRSVCMADMRLCSTL